MLDIVSGFLSACLISYAVVVVMPTWRWLLGMTLVVGLLLYADWSRHWIISSVPDSNEGPGCGIGAVLLFVATIGFAAGVIVRGLSLLLGSWGLRRRYIVMMCVAGAAIAPAIITFAPNTLTYSGPWSR
jgi:hypothetical protein